MYGRSVETRGKKASCGTALGNGELYMRAGRMNRPGGACASFAGFEMVFRLV